MLLAEVSLAVFFPMPTYDRLREFAPPVFSPSHTFPYRLKPNAFGRLVEPEFKTTIRINSQGHRGGEFSPEKDGRFRILATGDSFTFGWGVNDSETYPVQLERALQHRSDLGIEVINAGFAACYYPDTYYLYLKNIGLDLKPDLVVLGFFLGNDVDHAALGENEWTVVDETGLPVAISTAGSMVDENGYRTATTSRRRYRYPVLRNSHLVQLAASALRSRPINSGTSFNHWMYRDTYAQRTEDAISSVKTLLLATDRVTRDRNVPLLVVMMPAREQIRPSDYRFSEIPQMGDYDINKPQRLFSRFFEEHDIAYLDLLPLLRERFSRETLYFPRNAHWTARGNEVVGEVVAEYLTSRGALSALRRDDSGRGKALPILPE